jgi:hypothetical protein
MLTPGENMNVRLHPEYGFKTQITFL